MTGWVSCALLTLTATVFPFRTASADAEGEAGRVTRLRINAVGSDKYASYHGSLTLRAPGKGKSEVYYWGGSTCPAQKFTEAQVDLMASAFHNRTRTLLSPRYAESEGRKDTRCLVAFDLVAN